jgi:hypothetical protein
MKVISKKIRASARNEDCTLRISPQCQDGETVVYAHINSKFRGVGIKSPDIFGCYACHYCHSLLDSSQCSPKDVLRAMQETQMKLIIKGLIEVAA